MSRRCARKQAGYGFVQHFIAFSLIFQQIQCILNSAAHFLDIFITQDDVMIREREGHPFVVAVIFRDIWLRQMRTLRSLVTIAGLQSNPLNCKTWWGQTDLQWRKKSSLFKPASFFFFFFLEKPRSVHFNQHQVTVLCRASKGSWAVLVLLKY